MTKEEKLEEAKRLYKTANADQKYVLESLFPELKESEDDRIRKALIDGFKRYDGSLFNGCLVREIIAWLEKAGEHAKFRDSIQVGDQVTKNEDGVLVNLSQLKRVAKKDEKQGEQKPDKTFDSSKLKPDSNPYWTMAPEYQLANEQKPADKVEPKFKIGDWVVRNGETLQISGIDTMLGGTFHYWFTKGTWLSSKQMGNAMLWTIQDAKDGDVLATDSWLYIFKYTNNKNLIQFHCSCPIDGKPHKWCFSSDDSYLDIYIDANIHPATKEQRDLLFSKMKESGYEWDVEKKELKKIEQKPAWSEKDIMRIDNLIAIIEGKGYPDYVSWLKSLKDRVQPKPVETFTTNS